MHRLANTANSQEEHAAQAKHFTLLLWRHPLSRVGVDRCERAVACRERALHVTELAEELADPGLGFHLHHRELSGAGDRGSLPSDEHPSSESPLIELVARRTKQPEASRSWSAELASDPAKGLQVSQSLWSPTQHAVEALERFVG